jgi:DNA-binding Lrp family transcriptional regulator
MKRAGEDNGKLTRNAMTFVPLLDALLQDDRLTLSDVALYGVVYSFTVVNGLQCYAKNSQIGERINLGVTTISKMITKLERLGYLSRVITYREGTNQVEARYLTCLPLDVEYTPRRTDQDPLDVQCNTPLTCTPSIIDKDNNKVNNKGDLSKKFKIPTLEEVTDYCRERNNTLDAQNFIDFYSSKGWLVGKNKMKDWQACIRTWETNDKKRAKENANKQTASDKRSDYASNFYDYDKATNF